MRVVLVAQHYPPHFEGGTEAVVRGQARELAALGHEVSVVSGTDLPFVEGGVHIEMVDDLLVTFLYRRSDEPYDLILERPRLQRRVATLCEGADVVHLHHWTTLDNGLVRSLSADGRPVVVTLHDRFTACPRFFRVPAGGVERCPEPGDVEPCVRCCGADAPLPEEELRAGLRARSRVFIDELDAAAQLIAPSRAHANALAGDLGFDPGRFEVVPHGLARSLERMAPPPAPHPLRILHQGHRTSIKGTLDLVRALAALPEARRSEVELLCMGTEVESGFDQRLRSEAEAAGVRVVLEGAYDVQNLAALLSERGGAHLAAYPSRAPESYGLVVDEALALGIPCLVSDSGALPERLGGAGCVLPVGDVSAWTAAIQTVLADPSLLESWRTATPAGVPTSADAARALDSLYTRLLVC